MYPVLSLFPVTSGQHKESLVRVGRENETETGSAASLKDAPWIRISLNEILNIYGMMYWIARIIFSTWIYLGRAKSRVSF